MSLKSIYKSQEAKEILLKLYDEKLNSIQIEYEDIYIETSFGKTHIIVTGDQAKEPLVLLHGINAGAPVALEAIKNLRDNYQIFAIDTIGQTTKSAENRLNIKDDSYGKWLSETLDKLKIEKAPIIGISYGAFLVQKVMSFNPEKVEKGIFVVPGGIVNGSFIKSMKQLIFPLFKYLFSKSEKHLLQFMKSFYSDSDEYALAFQKSMLLGTVMDFRSPPLLQKKDVANLSAPVYGIFVDNDIFFPAEKAIIKCKHIFRNFKGYIILENTKHIPNKKNYQQIEKQIRIWLDDK